MDQDSSNSASGDSGSSSNIVINISDQALNNSKKRKRRSFIWDHCKIVEVTQNEIVQKNLQCNYCDIFFIYNEKANGSTSNIAGHLKTKHGDKLSINDSSATNVSFTFSQNQFRNALVNWTIVSNQPFTEAEQPSFRDLIRTLNPYATTISNDTLKSDVLTLFGNKLEEVKAKMKKIPGSISFSHDAWTSKNFLSFMSVRAHWINDSWEYEETMIDFPVITGNHTGKSLGKLFMESLDKIKVPLSKIFSFTMDNASNNDTFMDFIEDQANEQELDFIICERRIRCLTHVLNLSVQALLKNLKIAPTNDDEAQYQDPEIADDDQSSDIDMEINEDEDSLDEDESNSTSIYFVMKKLRSLVKKIRLSPQLRNKLKEICEIQKVKYLVPILDVRTRWNSTFLMIQRAEELKLPMNAICQSIEKLSLLILNENEWSVLKKLSSLLKNYEDATKIFSQSGHTISRYLPTFDFLLIQLDKFITESFDTCLKSAAQEAKSKLLEYKPKLENSSLPFFAVLLHPSMKMNYFHEKKYSKQEQKKIKNEFGSFYQRFYQEPSSEDPSSSSIVSQDKILAFMTERTQNEREVPEISKYLGKTGQGLATKTTHPLEWWKINGGDFPGLQRMARDIYSVQGASVGVERDFSSGVDLVSPTRCSLSPKVISATMCLKAWLKNDMV